MEELFENTNVVGSAELSDYLGLPRADICQWASENGVAVVGTSYAFIQEDAEALADELLDLDSGEDDEEDDGDGDDDEYADDDDGDADDDDEYADDD